ncbi:hypothetical protein HMPREF1486_01011 [Streptomyces sp. HPH0547]|uniref:hypothetical protein n=1 Tax=Streptomyces sp. HPH0547 TaxID=1203592 RepID=UPI00034E1763|nr:hypothetical protein [Streptomyces sp. HPH0547]EPD96412.1 hypothetical protein HMPREF1486_01011 [Streptomyces sp. HPH0547]
MNARRTRRTVRSAGLVAVAVAAALSLTACQGGDRDAALEKKDSASAAASSTGNGEAKSDAVRTEAGKAQAGGSSASATSSKKGSPDRTQKLADGSTAEIYKLGEQHYRAKIVNSGSVLATLETKGHDAGLDANDMFVVLTLGGEVHSWMGGGQQGPGTFKLAGGWTAKVKKLGELRYRAQIIGNEGVAATLETNGHDAGLDANGSYIVLSAGGVISAHA